MDGVRNSGCCENSPPGPSPTGRGVTEGRGQGLRLSFSSLGGAPMGHGEVIQTAIIGMTLGSMVLSAAWWSLNPILSSHAAPASIAGSFAGRIFATLTYRSTTKLLRKTDNGVPSSRSWITTSLVALEAWTSVKKFGTWLEYPISHRPSLRRPHTGKCKTKRLLRSLREIANALSGSCTLHHFRLKSILRSSRCFD